MARLISIDLDSLDYRPASNALAWVKKNCAALGYSIPSEVEVAMMLLDGRMHVASYSSIGKDPWAILLGSRDFDDADFDDMLAVAGLMGKRLKRLKAARHREMVAADIDSPSLSPTPAHIKGSSDNGPE